MNLQNRILSREGRLWAYGVVVAGLLVLAGYDIVSDAQVGLWVTLASAALGIGGAGLAAANVPPKDAYVGQHRKGE